jgi:hypothetical protein
VDGFCFTAAENLTQVRPGQVQGTARPSDQSVMWCQSSLQNFQQCSPDLRPALADCCSLPDKLIELMLLWLTGSVRQCP